MSEVRRVLVIVGCVAVGFVLSAGPGLMARAAEPERWVGAPATDASASLAREGGAQRRIAELERRVQELEAERAGVQAGVEPSELAAVTELYEELAARNAALTLENQQLLQSQLFEPSPRSAPACQPPDDTDPRAQLRYWAKQARDGESAFGLSPEWNAALNVLLRRGRQLRRGATAGRER